MGFGWGVVKWGGRGVGCVCKGVWLRPPNQYPTCNVLASRWLNPHTRHCTLCAAVGTTNGITPFLPESELPPDARLHRPLPTTAAPGSSSSSAPQTQAQQQTNGSQQFGV